MRRRLPGFGSLPCRAAVAATLVAATFVQTLPAAAAPVPLTETGSTLIYPLFQAWAAAYAKAAPDIKLALGATGSGEGIQAAIDGHVSIGASDAYMGDRDARKHPKILNIPLVISAQTVNVNLPQLHGTAIKLSGPVLAGIYGGSVRDWDDNAIAALNPGISLPHHAIVPVRRQDASGDTFIFTQFLTFSTPEWERRTGYGTTVDWPSVPGMQTATGNAGMVKLLAATPDSVGYVGASFEDEAAKAGLQVAPLLNAAGAFLLPTTATVTAAAAVLTPRTPKDERLTLVFAPGQQSYPLINYEYAVVSAEQPDPAKAAAIRALLLWCIDPETGSAANFVAPLHFIPLSISIRALSEAQIATIQ